MLGIRLEIDGKRRHLSAREEQVLQLALQGKTDAEIAEQLVITAHTVHNHMHAVRRKLIASGEVPPHVRERWLAHLTFGVLSELAAELQGLMQALEEALPQVPEAAWIGALSRPSYDERMAGVREIVHDAVTTMHEEHLEDLRGLLGNVIKGLVQHTGVENCSA